MMARIRKSMEEKDQGFTLIELLVVMIIIGILAAIAIPVFLNQRQKAVDSSTKSDLRTLAQEIESSYVDNQTYPAASTYTAAGTSPTVTGTIAPAARVSKDNVIKYKAVGATGYCLQGSNPNGSTGTTTYFWYSNLNGGLQSGAPSATGPTGC